ncbi:cold-shock DNA-binding domain protein [Mycobacterium tuberculosis]|nr:cold-shock DNA-binding domain protein [Mycobacterium tuberculosis]
MPTGKVKWYDPDKGFGFLSQEGGEDVYVRSSALPTGARHSKPGSGWNLASPPGGADRRH